MDKYWKNIAPVIKKKQFIIVYSAEVNKYFDSKNQFNKLRK